MCDVGVCDGFGIHPKDSLLLYLPAERLSFVVSRLSDPRTLEESEGAGQRTFVEDT
jgi:hypothetical protein